MTFRQSVLCLCLVAGCLMVRMTYKALRSAEEAGERARVEMMTQPAEMWWCRLNGVRTRIFGVVDPYGNKSWSMDAQTVDVPPVCDSPFACSVLREGERLPFSGRWGWVTFNGVKRQVYGRIVNGRFTWDWHHQRVVGWEYGPEDPQGDPGIGGSSKLPGVPGSSRLPSRTPEHGHDVAHGREHGKDPAI